MAEERSPYEDIAAAIGDVCMWWSNIEHEIHDLVLHLAMCLDPVFEKQGPFDVLHFTLSHMDVRQLIATAKSLATHVYDEHSPAFYERAEIILNFVDNDLRPERNRYVHDLWAVEGATISRSRLEPKIHRPQSRTRAFSTYAISRYSDLAAVRSLGDTLEQTYQDLAELDNHIAWLCEQRQASPTFQQPLPEEWKSIVRYSSQKSERPERPPRPFRNESE